MPREYAYTFFFFFFPFFFFMLYYIERAQVFIRFYLFYKMQQLSISEE